MTHPKLNRVREAIVAIALAAVATLAGARIVEADIAKDPGTSTAIYQNGVLVGEIFRADPPAPDVDPPDPDVDPPDPDVVDHWVLYPRYVYPTAESGVVTTLVPRFRSYGGGLAEFLETVPFEVGSRYVRVDNYDRTGALRR